jgi:hypothetical protein
MNTVNDDLVLVRGLDVTARRTDQVVELSARAAGGVLLETLIGRYVLDRDAREVWLLIDGRHRIGDVVERIAETSGLPPEQIRPPVHDLCARLLELGLVQDVTPADAAVSAPLTAAAL